MGRITCEQYLAMPPSRSNDFSAWMSGRFSFENDRPFVGLVVHQKNIASVKEWCKFHPGESVITGLKKAIIVN
jgi:HdeA/HdeB family